MAVAYAEYAGVKLPLWTPDCDRALAAAGLDPDRVHRFDAEPDTTGLQGLPLPPRAEPPPFRGGTLWWPLGASQWARAHFVIDAAKLTAIRAALVTASGSSSAGYVAATFKLSDGRGGTDWSGALHLLPPIPIVGTDDSYLLTLVDERYYWWFRPTISLSAVTTWSGLYSAIGTGIGSTVTVDGSLTAFAAPSTRWQSLGGQPLPLLLDAAAWCTGRRIVRRADGTVRATDYATAKAAAAAVQSAWGSTYRRRGGGQSVTTDSQKSAPASVLVRSGSLSQTVTLSSLAIADYSSVTGKSGYRATLNTDAATLTTGQAEALAREWYQWLLAREDVSFAGVAAFTTNGWYGAVEYAFRRDEVGTRILPPPFEFGHSSGSVSRSPAGVLSLCVTKTAGNVTDIRIVRAKDDGTVVCETVPLCGECEDPPPSPPPPPPPPPTEFGSISGTVTTMPGDVPTGGRTVVESLTGQGDISDVVLGTYSLATIPPSSSGHVIFFAESGEAPSYRRDGGTWYAGVSCPVTTPGGTGWTVDVDWRIYAAGANPDPTEPT